MGILARFKDIMASNINALLDKAEDPEKMIDQTLRNLNSDLGKVKSETAAVMAEEVRAKRELDQCVEEMKRMQNYAVKAVEAGNDEDAKQFLSKKNQLALKQEQLQATYEVAAKNAAQMRQMHDKLVSDINELESRKSVIKTKLSAAKAQERINKISSSVGDAADSISAFERMEDKANKALDQANAMAELNASKTKESLKDLELKYGSASSGAVDDELAALKASMGK
jgi:phage shock protein A